MNPFCQSINSVSRRQVLHSLMIPLGLGFWSPPDRSRSSSSRDRVTFGTNWYAQAEHGGFYQAVATGIYADHGLEVTLQMGGAGVNILQLLASGAVDFAMGSSFDVLAAVQAGIPLTTVAAICQRDPQCLLAHPNMGIERLADLKGKPIYVSTGANLTYWPFLRGKFGFTDDQKRPYNSSLGPFLLDQSSAQQGYITSEPYRVHQEAGFDPVTFLLADYGYLPYATTIETTQERVRTQPDLVQRFVDASIEGWYSYLRDPEPANRLIKQENPRMSDGLLAFALQQLIDGEFLTGGDAAELGIGVMTAERWQALVEMSIEAGGIEPDIAYRQAFTLEFVGRGSEYRLDL